MVADMGLSGAVRSLALNCQFLGQRDGVVRLALDPRFQAAKTPGIEAKLQQALGGYFGGPVRLEFVAEAARRDPGPDPGARAAARPWWRRARPSARIPP